MKQIRQGVFETNSSSCHTLVVCSKEEYDAWVNGELLLHEWNNNFKSRDSLNQFTEEQLEDYYNKTKQMFWKDWNDLSEEEKEEVCNQYMNIYDETSDYQTYAQYQNRLGDLEYYEERYTSKSGDEIVIFGEFGYDG